jgi:hypothetical protein
MSWSKFKVQDRHHKKTIQKSFFSVNMVKSKWLLYDPLFMWRFPIQDVTNMDNSEQSNVNNMLGLVYGVYRHFQQHFIFSC